MTTNERKRALEWIKDYVGLHWEGSSMRLARTLAMQMRAALEMVLLFHMVGPWLSEHTKQWMDLQKRAGIDAPDPSATTRVLCDVIRKVLGIVEDDK